MYHSSVFMTKLTPSYSGMKKHCKNTNPEICDHQKQGELYLRHTASMQVIRAQKVFKLLTYQNVITTKLQFFSGQQTSGLAILAIRGY